MNVAIAHTNHHFDAEPHGIGLKTHLCVASMILRGREGPCPGMLRRRPSVNPNLEAWVVASWECSGW